MQQKILLTYKTQVLLTCIFCTDIAERKVTNVVEDLRRTLEVAVVVVIEEVRLQGQVGHSEDPGEGQGRDQGHLSVADECVRLIEGQGQDHVLSHPRTNVGRILGVARPPRMRIPTIPT